MNYIKHRGKLSFQTSSFSSVECLSEYALNNIIDILLIGEDAITELDSLREKAKYIFILTKKRDSKECSSYPGIYKFQSADLIVMEIMEYYMENNTQKRLIKTAGNNQKTICTFSLSEKSKKTIFSLALGSYYGSSYKTLYINLDLFSRLSFLNSRESPGFSELLYYIKQRNPNLIMKLETIVQTCNNFDVIPPAGCYQDLLEVNEDDIVFFLQYLHDYSNYEIVIFDTSFSGKNILPLLHSCNQIYVAVDSDFLSKDSKNAFYEQMKEGEENEVLEKMKEVILPWEELMPPEDFISLDMFNEGSIYNYVAGLLETVV